MNHDLSEIILICWFAAHFFNYQCYIYIYAFSRRFYPKRLTVHSGYTCFITMCVPWESNPQPFALLTQCSTTEPQEPQMLKIFELLNSFVDFFFFSELFGELKVQKNEYLKYIIYLQICNITNELWPVLAKWVTMSNFSHSTLKDLQNDILFVGIRRKNDCNVALFLHFLS